VDSDLRGVRARACHVCVLFDPNVCLALHSNHRTLRTERQSRLRDWRTISDVHVRDRRLFVAGHQFGKETVGDISHLGRGGFIVRGDNRILAVGISVFREQWRHGGTVP